MCGCGHVSGLSAVVVVPAFAFSLWVYFSQPRGGFCGQVFSTVPLGLMGAACVSVLVDILYLGHEPLLR